MPAVVMPKAECVISAVLMLTHPLMRHSGRYLDRNRNARSNIDIRVDGDTIGRRRLRHGLSMFDRNLDPSCCRLLRIGGSLTKCIPGTGAAGQVGKEDAEAVLYLLEDCDVLATRHLLAPEPDPALPLDLAQRTNSQVFARMGYDDRTGLVGMAEDVMTPSNAVEGPAITLKFPNDPGTIHVASHRLHRQMGQAS